MMKKSYKTPVISILKNIKSPILAGSLTYTNGKGDNTKAVLSKEFFEFDSSMDDFEDESKLNYW